MSADPFFNAWADRSYKEAAREVGWEYLLKDLIRQEALVGEIEQCYASFWNIPVPATSVEVRDYHTGSVYFVEVDDTDLEALCWDTHQAGDRGLSVWDWWLMEGVGVLVVALVVLCILSKLAQWWVFR